MRRKLTGCARRLQAKTKLLHFTVDCSKPVRRGDFRGSARLAAPMSFMAADAVCRKSEMSSVQNSWDGNIAVGSSTRCQPRLEHFPRLIDGGSFSSAQVEDKIMDIATFEKFLVEHFKVEGKLGAYAAK